jgi:hypothetical protein
LDESVSRLARDRRSTQGLEQGIDPEHSRLRKGHGPDGRDVRRSRERRRPASFGGSEQQLASCGHAADRSVQGTTNECTVERRLECDVPFRTAMLLRTVDERAHDEAARAELSAEVPSVPEATWGNSASSSCGP